MTFDEVIQALQATPGLSFTGLALRSDGRCLGVFTAYSRLCTKSPYRDFKDFKIDQ